MNDTTFSVHTHINLRNSNWISWSITKKKDLKIKEDRRNIEDRYCRELDGGKAQQEDHDTLHICMKFSK